jgi:hypothetical protein
MLNTLTAVILLDAPITPKKREVNIWPGVIFDGQSVNLSNMYSCTTESLLSETK